MKIHNPNDLSAVSAPGVRDTAGLEGSGRKESGRGSGAVGSDSAELSGLAGKISKATANDAASRAGKVEELRKLVSANAYQPDSAAIAKGVVNDGLSGAGKK
jgi:hypothetical protein